jgi:hypothetical protein
LILPQCQKKKEKLSKYFTIQKGFIFYIFLFLNTYLLHYITNSPATGHSPNVKRWLLKQMYSKYETCHECNGARANGGATGGRNQNINQYGACHAVEYRRSSWPAQQRTGQEDWRRAVLDCVACAILIHIFVSVAGRAAVRRCAWHDKYIAMRLFQSLDASPFAYSAYWRIFASRGQAKCVIYAKYVGAFKLLLILLTSINNRPLRFSSVYK